MQTKSVILFLLILLVCVTYLWLTRASHPLWPPDEGRYGTVSMEMVQTGDWLIPKMHGQPHLTKPPLTYWLQSCSLRLLGHNELALRTPSLLASSLTILLVFIAGWRWRSMRTGVLAAGVLSVMPLHLGTGWVAITDPMLNLFWFAALFAGMCAVQKHKRRWAALMWLAVALGLLTKGPLALVPIAIVVFWLLPGLHFSALRILSFPVGLPAACLPLGLWIGYVLSVEPHALDIWQHEMVDRVAGDGAHIEPFWFYIPVFLGGLFPATAMLTLPGYNVPLHAAGQSWKGKHPASLWALAVVVPLVLFSCMSGKLASYLLPLTPPLALLTANMLEDWLTRKHDQTKAGFRPPEVVITLNVCCFLIFAGALIATGFVESVSLWMVFPLILLPVVSVIVGRMWRRQPTTRKGGLLALWLTMIACFTWVLLIEEQLFYPRSTPKLLTETLTPELRAGKRLVSYGFNDPTLSFYTQQEVAQISRQYILEFIDQGGKDLMIIASSDDWSVIQKQHPDHAQRFMTIGTWSRWPDKPTLVLQLTPNKLPPHDPLQ